MQQAPCRLSQALWFAFRAAKPVHRPRAFPHQTFPQPRQTWATQSSSVVRQARFYSEKGKEIDRKVQDAKDRIDDTIEARAAVAAESKSEIKEDDEATIIKTRPVSSSIVEPPATPGEEIPQAQQSSHDAGKSATFRSQADTTANLRARFGAFMDNFQSHLFVASRRLNDLTGYTTIEQLKNDISAQESLVQRTRQEVKSARDAYSAAVATRSTTQREVNDLLHRKHNWSPNDLERFTSLYRSDHANEQSEVAAQKEVADAETRYEEASTKLGRAILARYHEEQVWSDKIRQMSTWGTWGLMGLNVLLFVVFQILIEPWRRRRLVKGFEEKVEVALQERDVQLAGLRSSVDSHAAATAAAARPGASSTPTTAASQSTGAQAKAEAVAEAIAEHIADAVSGAAPPSSSTSQADAEAAADAVVAKEIAAEQQQQDGNGNGVFASGASGYAYYAEAFQQLWSEQRTLVVTQRELTTHVLEGMLTGAAVTGLLMALLRPR
jgi:sensitive to high expression protein 9, mitochondrial